MGKYRAYTRPAQKPRPWKVHPIWRGIGCLMILIIPAMSYAGGVLLVEQNMKYRWIPMPAELTKSMVLPLVGRVSHFYATLMATVVLMLIGFAIIVTIYALIYNMVGPSRLGPMDAPPERRRR
jgi:hypothetical protein